MHVVVTGASQGIGAAVAELFAGEPEARLTLLARNVRQLERTAARCRRRGASAEPYPCDVTDPVAVGAVAERVLQHGPPQVLVNNAGRFEPGSLDDTDVDAFRQSIEVNLTSAFLVSRALVPAMSRAGRGHLFFLASVASLKAYPGGLAYCAAKHGVLGLARALREELRERGVRVTALLPGATWTPSWQSAGLPEERLMPAGDVARVVLDAYRLSSRSVVEEILIRPQLGDV